MDPSDLPDQNSGDFDEVHLLKKKLADTEDKLVKFKKFVVTLRNERAELQEKLSESNLDVDKLKSELAKFQGKSYQQIFQNFQNLQIEYDKIQDDVELSKKTNKSLESDLLKCGQELSNCRETCANQEEELGQLKGNSSQLQSQINGLTTCNQELESRIIVLQAEYKNEKKKSNDFQICENERTVIKEELNQKTWEITELNERLEQSSLRLRRLESDIVEKDSRLNQFEELEREKQQLSADKLKHYELAQSQQEQIEEYSKTIEELTQGRDQLEKKVADLQLDHSQKLSSFELAISELQNKLSLTEQDLNLNNNKFEEYKQRVSNVVKENKLNNFEYNKNIEELNFKIESLQDENNFFRSKCSEQTRELEGLHSENETLKGKQLSCQNDVKNYEELKAKLTLVSKENSKLSNIIDQLKVTCSREKQSILDEHSASLENIKAKYENRIRELEDEIVNFRIPSDDSNSIGNSNTSFEEIKEENLSFQSSNNSNTERNFLEEILNIDSSSNKSSEAPHHSSNIDNLTQLLSESENSITLLSEQNRLLKEEIRRLQRSVDRMDIANNLEYLKNVFMKFLTIKGVDERERLITVLTTILKLTPEERELFHQCVQEGNSAAPNSKWSLWQWS